MAKLREIFDRKKKEPELVPYVHPVIESVMKRTNRMEADIPPVDYKWTNKVEVEKCDDE